MEQTTWKQALKDSSWITIAWDWFQNLLGRSVEGVLWGTMILTCYQLIPGVPSLLPGVSAGIFIVQFIGLDVGGLGLNKICQQQGLPKWAYARWISYILITITLVTVSFAGLERAITTLDKNFITAVEVILVVARSIMTVLYGQAIHSLKHTSTNMRDELSNLQSQLDTRTQEANSLRGQLDTLQKTASDLRGQLQAKNGQLESVQSQLSSVQLDTQNLRVQLDTGQQELNNLRLQLQRKDVALATLQGQLDTRQQEVSSLQNQVSSLQQEASANLREAQLLQAKLDTQLDSRMDTGHPTGQQNGQVDTSEMDTGQHKIISLAGHSTGQMDTDRIEQVRQLLKNNPDMSARAIANIIGCSPTTASKLKEQAS